MKARLIALAFALTIVAGTAAQGNCYPDSIAYVSGPMNIRQSHSIDSPVVRRAAAGDSFPVSSSTQGSRYCWLDIPPGWMAWTARVSASPPGGTTAPAVDHTTRPSNIDNCCFLDRQCLSHQEWVDGYWAFQRNECPAQPQPGTTSASTGGHAISIEGSSEFVKLMSEALDLLRARSQSWHNFVISGIDRLIEDERHYTMAAFSSQRTVRAAPYRRHIIVSRDYMRNVVRVASGLVHEACHIHCHEAGYVYGPYTKVAEEVACIQNEKAILSLAFPNYADEYGLVGVQHCEGSLENHPRCRGFDVCEWSADRSRIISCPAIGLTRPST